MCVNEKGIDEGYQICTNGRRGMSHTNSRKGYSGVVTYCKEGITVDACEGMGNEKFDKEGRIVRKQQFSAVIE